MTNELSTRDKIVDEWSAKYSDSYFKDISELIAEAVKGSAIFNPFDQDNDNPDSECDDVQLLVDIHNAYSHNLSENDDVTMPFISEYFIFLIKHIDKEPTTEFSYVTPALIDLLKAIDNVVNGYCDANQYQTIVDLSVPVILRLAIRVYNKHADLIVCKFRDFRDFDNIVTDSIIKNDNDTVIKALEEKNIQERLTDSVMQVCAAISDLLNAIYDGNLAAEQPRSFSIVESILEMHKLMTIATAMKFDRDNDVIYRFGLEPNAVHKQLFMYIKSECVMALFNELHDALSKAEENHDDD